MKTLKYITLKHATLCSLVLLILSSCMTELKQELTFGATVNTATAQLVKDTIVVKKDSTFSFNFTGNPQNIVFYSGEDGLDYKSINTTEIPVSQIDSCFLKFDVTPTGTNSVIPNTLSLLLSDNFTGLTNGSSYLTDSTNIRNNSSLFTWADSTLACGFPTTSGVKKSVKMNMMKYMSKRVCFQFKYQTIQNTIVQPSWTIANLKFVRYQKGKLPVEMLAANLGLISFDILYKSYAYAPYSQNPGTWDKKTNTANIVMSSTPIGKPMNEDYLINSPILLNAFTPSTGIVVKNLSNNLADYSYKYSSTGIYNVTFVASNENFLDNGQQKLVTFVVKVI